MDETPNAGKNAFIAAFLALQILVPLGYYLGEGGSDERFRWRMFSSVRLQRCRISVHAWDASGRRRVDPGQDIQVAWVNLLRRNRPQVVEGYLTRVCETQDVERVRLRGRCRDTDGTELPTIETVRACQPGAGGS